MSDCTNTTQGASGDGSAKFYYNGATGGAPYGDPLASDSAGAASTGVLAMLGSTSATQVAGIYTTTLIVIATGTI